jgi:hypothetical protein
MKLRLTITVPNWLDRIFTWPLLTYRRLRFGYPFRRIHLTDGMFALVDPQDFYWLNNFDWFSKINRTSFYAVRFNNDLPKGPTMVSMHRQIMNFPKGLIVDHRNLDGLDNRRSNLRIATYSENNCNKAKRKNTSSCFVGVCFDKRCRRWVAYIQMNRKRIQLGYFDSEIDAARAYDRAAREYHKEFARLNFPNEQSTLLSTND